MGNRLKRLQAAAEREHARRAAVASKTLETRITEETLCAGHGPQLRMVLDPALYMIVLCSRRAGKTYGLAVLALLRALRNPRSNILYVGLSKPHARKFLWNEVWCPLLDRLKIPHKRLEDEMTTTFHNGSIMYISGTDDVRHIESFLGNRLDLAIVDEAQSQSDSVLVPLTTRILPNALLDDMDRPGKLVMAGTIPEVNAGRFMEVWGEGKWSRHNWSRFDNPHLRNQVAALEAFLTANPGMTEDSPEVGREWKGQFMFDPSATAYKYIEEINGYHPDVPDWLDEAKRYLAEFAIVGRPPGIPTESLFAAVPRPGIELFSAAIDPGTVDRAALVVLGWGSDSTAVQQVFEWATPRRANVTWAQIGAVAGIVQKRFGPTWWHYDAGSSKNELDIFGRDYGIPVIKAANKSDFPGQVRRTNDLLTQARLDVMIGSGTAKDMQKARFDPDGRAKGLWKWAAAHHPDPTECARYALDPYWNTYEPKETRTVQERARAEFYSDDEPELDEPEGRRDPLSAALGHR